MNIARAETTNVSTRTVSTFLLSTFRLARDPIANSLLSLQTQSAFRRQRDIDVACCAPRRGADHARTYLEIFYAIFSQLHLSLYTHDIYPLTVVKN